LFQPFNNKPEHPEVAAARLQAWAAQGRLDIALKKANEATAELHRVYTAHKPPR
jgi:hypothetical protein